MRNACNPLIGPNTSASRPPIVSRPVIGDGVSIGVGISIVVLLLPVLAAPIPPLTDYPNHLARLWLLANAATPPMPGVYAVAWDTLTNIGIDLLGVALSRVFETPLVGRILVAIAILLVPLGGVALWRVLHGRVHWWQVSFSILAWGFGLLDGFLNFQIGLGLALLATALDILLIRGHPASAALLRACCGFVILLVHPFGFIFYGALLCGVALGPGLAWPARWQDAMARFRPTLAAVLPLVVPFTAYVVLSPRLPGLDGVIRMSAVADDFLSGLVLTLVMPGFKFAGLLVGLRTYSNTADAVAMLFLAMPVVIALATGQLAVHAGMLMVVLGCLVCFLVSPFRLADATWVDCRFTCMAPLALALALRPEPPPQLARLLLSLLLTASMLRTGLVGSAWHERQADFSSLQRALAQMPTGSSVFAVEHRIDDSAIPPLGRYLMVGEPTFRHVVTLAIPWHRAFVPTLFADRGQQPVQVLPPWDKLAVAYGGTLLSVDALVHPEAYRAVIKRTPYLRQWWEDMDYVVVVNADLPDLHGPFIPPPQLELVADEGFVQVFRIRH